MPHIRKGDTVKVIAGKEKGKSGKVLEVLLEKGRVRVEKLMTVKRSLKKGRSQTNVEGGIIEKTGSIAISNVMVLGKGGEPGRREAIERELGAKETARRSSRGSTPRIARREQEPAEGKERRDGRGQEGKEGKEGQAGEAGEAG